MSTQRAFVIQFLPRTAAAPERFEGRIEHVGSGEAADFRSPLELIDFLSRLLGGHAPATGKPARAERAVRSGGRSGPMPG
ncbi:MAG TPA: hypothetical protein VIS07_23030 [Candidatus Binatia bacterium]